MKPKETKTSLRKMMDKLAAEELIAVDFGKQEKPTLVKVPTVNGDILIEQSTGSVWYARRATIKEDLGLSVVDPTLMVRADELAMNVRLKNSMASVFVVQALNDMEESYVENKSKNDQEEA